MPSESVNLEYVINWCQFEKITSESDVQSINWCNYNEPEHFMEDIEKIRKKNISKG